MTFSSFFFPRWFLSRLTSVIFFLDSIALKIHVSIESRGDFFLHSSQLVRISHFFANLLLPWVSPMLLPFLSYSFPVIPCLKLIQQLLDQTSDIVPYFIEFFGLHMLSDSIPIETRERRKRGTGRLA